MDDLANSEVSAIISGMKKDMATNIAKSIQAGFDKKIKKLENLFTGCKGINP